MAGATIDSGEITVLGGDMLRILGRKDSSNVQKVLWCCGELGLPFEREDIGGKFGKNKETAYLAINPNGLVPTLQDGDFLLWESNSIVRYLVDKYGADRLLPDTPEGRADANRWMDWQLTTLGPTMVPIFVGLIRTPENQRDPESIGRSIEQGNTKWAIVEQYLARHDYLAGDSLTIGDIPVGIWAYRWFSLPIQRKPLPRLEGWYQRLCERPAFKEHVMIPLK
jgi:glutathione S-transferase